MTHKETRNKANGTNPSTIMQLALIYKQNGSPFCSGIQQTQASGRDGLQGFTLKQGYRMLEAPPDKGRLRETGPPQHYLSIRGHCLQIYFQSPSLPALCGPRGLFGSSCPYSPRQRRPHPPSPPPS